MKKVFRSLAFILVLGIGSIGWAADSHNVSIAINPYTQLSVTGAAFVTIYKDDFINGYANKNLNSTVQIAFKTNKENNCKIYASASGDFSPTFPVSRLKAKVDVNGANYVSLATTPVELITFITKNNNKLSVLFRVEEISETEEAGNYNVTITYTAVVYS